MEWGALKLESAKAMLTSEEPLSLGEEAKFEVCFIWEGLDFFRRFYRLVLRMKLRVRERKREREGREKRKMGDPWINLICSYLDNNQPILRQLCCANKLPTCTLFTFLGRFSTLEPFY